MTRVAGVRVGEVESNGGETQHGQGSMARREGRLAPAGSVHRVLLRPKDRQTDR